jgi:uncharacterized Zn-binding protein involved in type VI secretion
VPGVVRLGDKSCGLDCKSTPAIECSPDVFVNGRGVVRVGDAFEKHCGHSRKVAVGSPNVYVNGKSVCRIGDKLTCGDKTCQGSSDVFVNGG